MNERKEREQIKAAFESGLSGMQEDPWLAQRILAAQKKPRRMRISRKAVILVIVTASLLLSSAAAAWFLSPRYFEEIAGITMTGGDYADWSLEEKRYMVQTMGKYGILTEGAARRLSQRTEAEIDSFMLERYGAESAPGDLGWISINRIAMVEMGPYVYWDNDAWIWYTNLMLETGLWDQNGDFDRFYVPGDEAVAPATAIENARQSLLKSGVSVQRLDSARVIWHYMAGNADTERKYLRYYITFLYPDQSEDRVTVLPSGEVCGSQ